MQIQLSQIKRLPFDFEAEVKAFVQVKMDHRFTVGEPAPSAPHPLIEHAVKRISRGDGKPDDFEVDYEIEDDTPPPPDLGQRKQELANQVSQAAIAAMDAVIPPLKKRLWLLEYHKVNGIEDNKRTSAQKAVVTDYLARQAKLETIHYKLAQHESEIHDLTEKTIDGWTFPPF